MHATFVTLWLQVMQPLANVHETKWTLHVKRESDVAVHIIAVVAVRSNYVSKRGFPEADIVADAYTSRLALADQFVHHGSSRG